MTTGIEGLRAFVPCVLIPVYNHPLHIGRIVDTLVAQRLPVLLVDDGSDAATRAVLDAIQARHAEAVVLERLPHNLGKGGAVSHGLRHAHALGYTHALQVDADGQHDLADVPAFLEDARQRPQSVICGTPHYDASVPRGRLYGRYITHFWVWVETLSFDIVDSMCGFRVYPLAATAALLARHQPPSRMAFDTDILVRLYWRGVPVHSKRTRVVYPKNGISHFQMFGDNVAISLMHTRLVFGMMPRAPALLWRALRCRASVDVSRTQAPASASTDSSLPWWRRPERGSLFGMRLLAFACRCFGLRAARACLVPVVAYFALRDTQARAASRDYQQRLRNAAPEIALPKPTFWRTFAHLSAFANAALDKFAAWRGLLGEHHVQIDDPAALDAAANDSRGALVIGSHLGNLEMTRALARSRGIDRIHAVVYTRHAQRFRAMLAGSNIDFAANLIEVDDIGPATAIMLRERIERGDWLVIVGDRVPSSDSGRVVHAPFLGAPAPFAQGPFILAALLECPVFLLFCLRDRTTYRLYFEAFADIVTLPRASREASLRTYAERYASRLEYYCRRYPMHWFNFFDFWRSKSPK
ncbi:glycosyltransferase family 2 protein [Pandoraea oxalativorans]|uniref:Acyltransferase n=1 Tax=Pandoraea oxalativorans TaxID=573737 RepID=A0A0E3YFA2_9BURK|nr:glycosyltransferase family 2 protein [Pandoraea oxalativorans]AKC70996.1 acyltransferase [Pandoraea oxalativorans]